MIVAAVQAGNEFVYVRLEDPLDPSHYRHDVMDFAHQLDRLADVYCRRVMT